MSRQAIMAMERLLVSHRILITRSIYMIFIRYLAYVFKILSK